MNRTYRIRTALLSLGLLALLLAVPVGLTYWQVRQERLNHALVAAVKRNDTPSVRHLLRDGADPNAPVLPEDRRSFWHRLWDMVRHRPSPHFLAHDSALLEAVNGVPLDNVGTVQALVEAGANINVRDRNNDTLLMRAVARRKWKTMQLLLSYHADVNATNTYGGTALVYAIELWKADMVEVLLQHGADISLRRQSSFLAAALQNYATAAPEQVRATVACLLRHGAFVEGEDQTGTTALGWAQFYEDKALIRMLQQAGAKE